MSEDFILMTVEITYYFEIKKSYRKSVWWFLVGG